MEYEQRANESLVRMNELQETVGEWQIKYYRVQQQCDNLRAEID